MILKDLVEDKIIKDQLLEIFKTNKFPNSILFYGNNSSRLNEISKLVTAAAVCEYQEVRPCLKCSCCKKIKEDFHPDVIYVKPEKDSLFIGVDEIRKIKKKISIKPNEAIRKIYVIENAEKMTHQAQNAVLKILEEPPRFVLFILTCLNIENLLETVLSRCQKFFVSCDFKIQDKEMKNSSMSLLEAIAKGDKSKIFSLVIDISKNKQDFEKSLNLMLVLLQENTFCLDLKSLENLLNVISITLTRLKQNIYLDLLSTYFSSKLLGECYGKFG